MILSNVNIGTGPSAGDGDPLRTAFNTINENFEKIESNVNALTNSVSSVAGRTGNVTLTINDIVGFTPSVYPNASTINSMISTAVSTAVTNLVDGAPGALDTLNELASALGDDSSFATTVLANLSTLTSNAGVQAQSITTLQSNVATLQANALAQQGLIANLQSTSYGNANVSAYLPGYTGNVGVGNLVFNDLSVQTTAYTGAQWRSNLTSSLVTKPTWLSYVPGGKNQEGTQYGFDADGMFFRGNADNDFAYPVQTNIRFHEDETLEVTATVRFNQSNNDQGLAIFNADTRPIWRASTDSSRIAFQFDAGIPVLYGQTTANTAPGIPVLSPGNWYTVKFVYNPGLVTVSTYAGNVANGSALDVRTISETLPAGDYSVGFDADMDQAGVKSYFTNLTVRTFSDTAVNDLEVIGTAVVGNVIPSANVTYSLGNVSHQWKDLWVSNNTIYINSVPLSIDSGGSLLVNGAPISSTSNVAFTDTTMTGAVDSEVVVAAATSERVRAQLRLNPTDGDAFLETWSYENTRSDATWTTGTWDLNIYGNPRIEFTGAFDLANFIVNTLQSLVDPDTVSYSINGGEYIPWDGGSSADPVTGYASIGTNVPPPVNPTAITSIDWKYAFKSQIGLSYGSNRVEIQTANQDLDININGYVQLYSSGSIDINNSQNNNDITLYSGDDILLQGKNKTTSDTEGGDINIRAGNGGMADLYDAGGGGGDIQIDAGAGGDASTTYNAGQGGFTRLRGGQGGGANASRNAGLGGYIEISAGDGGDNIGNVNQGAAGGDIDIISGDSTLANTAGGHITLSSGVGGFNAPSGYVEINIPLSDAGPGGTWTFTGEGTILNVPQNAEIFNPSVGNLTVGSAGNVFVRTVDPSLTSHTWEFTEYGALRFPSVVNALYQIYETEGGLELDSEGGFYIVSNVAPGQGGGSVWSFQANGNLIIPGDITFANGVSVLGVNGNITVGNSAVNFVSNSSGDGYGYSTIEIRPDDVNTSMENYLIIDPTSPNHIHIRAGGEQDNSQAELYLGGENSYFKVDNGANPDVSIAANSYVWSYGVDGNITFPSGGGIIFDSSAVSKIDGITSVIFADSTEQATAFSNLAVSTYLSSYDGSITFTASPAIISGLGTISTVNANISGNITFGDSTVQTTAWTGNVDNLTSGVYTLSLDSSSGVLTLPAGGDIRSVNNPVDISVRDTGNIGYAIEHSVRNGTNTIQTLTSLNSSEFRIYTDFQGVNNQWAFGNTGTLTFPDGTVQSTAFTGTAVSNYGNANVVSLLSNFGSNSITTTGNITAAWLSGNISITGNVTGTQPNVTLVAGSYSWTFDNTGNLVLPGNVFSVNYANGTVVSLGGTSSTYSNSNVASYLTTYTGNVAAGNILVTSAYRFASGAVTITNDSSSVVLTPDTNANALAGVRIGGNGYLLAPNGARNITLNYGGGSGVVGLQANVQVGSAGSGGTVFIPGFTTTGITTIVAGVTNTLLPNTVASFSSNVNSYTQLTLQNKSTGADATSDVVLTSDAGSDTTNYLDLGIINSGYDNATPTNSLGNVVYANDSYLYAQGNTAVTSGGNLVIGATTSGKAVKIFAGGNTSSAVMITVANTGVTVSGNVNAGNIITTGNIVGSSPNVTITANTYVTTFDVYGNVSMPGNLTVNGMGVTMPARPAFRVNGINPGSQSNIANVNLKGAAITTVYNQGGYFDATTGKFTAPVAGIYEVLLNARVNSSFNGLAEIAVLKNGLNSAGNIVCFWETTSNIGGATHFGVSGTVQLAAGDYLSANILVGNITFDSNDNWSVTYLG